MLKRSVTITILCVVACACMRQRDQSGAERYIIESERQWAESVATGDASVVERILADDFAESRNDPADDVLQCRCSKFGTRRLQYNSHNSLGNCIVNLPRPAASRPPFDGSH